MVADTDVINGDTPAETPDGQSKAPTPKRAWSMPKAPVSRKQVDDAGRAAAKAAAGVAKTTAAAIAALARSGARAATQLWRAICQVPAALRLLFVVAILVLLGVVGSIALSGTAGLVSAVVVVPVASITLGALGHRWYSRHGAAPALQSAASRPEMDSTDLARSIAYVDRKLTQALNSFGSERHQQAVIALFQAKTAVELALGTEQDTAGHIDEPVSVEDYGLRPRIQAGPASKSLTSESTSLAAS